MNLFKKDVLFEAEGYVGTLNLSSHLAVGLFTFQCEIRSIAESTASLS